MTNPNNAIGTNGAFGGRTSVNAFNDIMGALSRGVLSGWACVPNSGLTVSLGGDGTTRDTAIAEDNAGNKTSINNISNSPVNVTIGAAPGTNSRIDAIVAYVDNPPSGTSTVTDNPGACGLIVVEGNTASSPVAPNDSSIRTAITADGASGTTAYYVVLAYVTMASGTTDITASEITDGATAQVNNNIVSTDSIADNAVTADKIDFTTLSIAYKEIDTTTDFNSPSTAFEDYYPANWELSFDTEQNGMYLIEADSKLLYSNGSGELDMKLEATSGLEIIADKSESYCLRGDIGSSPSCKIIARATANTAMVKVVIASEATNTSTHFYGGMITVKRIG